MVRNSPNTALGVPKTTANDRAHMYTAFVIHKSIAISATGTQNVARPRTPHEINFVLMLDGKECQLLDLIMFIQI